MIFKPFLFLYRILFNVMCSLAIEDNTVPTMLEVVSNEQNEVQPSHSQRQAVQSVGSQR